MRDGMFVFPLPCVVFFLNECPVLLLTYCWLILLCCYKPTMESSFGEKRSSSPCPWVRYLSNLIPFSDASVLLFSPVHLNEGAPAISCQRNSSFVGSCFLMYSCSVATHLLYLMLLEVPKLNFYCKLSLCRASNRHHTPY